MGERYWRGTKRKYYGSGLIMNLLIFINPKIEAIIEIEDKNQICTMR